MLADAFTAIAEVFELVGARSEPVDRSIDTAEPVECAHDAAELERVLGPKPKSPLSISKLYHRDHAKAMSALNPDLNSKEVKKLISAQWEKVSDEERQQYRDRSSALYRQYKIDVTAYDARVQALIATAYGMSEVPNAVDELLERELGPKPKPPTPAKHIYRDNVIGDILEENPGIHTIAARRLAGIRWNSLSEEGRRPFKDRHDALKKQYEIDDTTYNARKLALLSTCHKSVLMGHIVEPRHPTSSTSPDHLPLSIEQLNELEATLSDEELERELGPKPKRPTSVTSMYRSGVLNDIRKENPGIHTMEAQRLVAIRWKSLSEEDRRPFKDRYDARNKQYKIDKAAYNARKMVFLSTRIESVSTARHAEPEPEATQSDEELERELGPKPRRPLDISKLYHRDHTKAISAQNPDLSYDEVKKLISTQWGKVSDEERQQYRDRSSALYRQYKIDVAAYDARVQALISTAYGEPEAPNAVDELLERELGPKPKPPTPAQLIYRDSVISDIREENPGIHTIAARRLAGIRWKTLSEEDRRPFKDRHDALKEQYKINIAAYDARECALLKAAVCKLGGSREPHVANTSDAVQSSQHPVPSISPGLLPQPIEHLNGPQCTTTSVSSRFTTLLSSQPPPPPPPIESFSSPRPAGSPTPLQSILPSGTVSWPANHSGPSLPAGPSGAVAPSYPLAISWPAEVTLPDESPESTSLPASSGGLPGPTMATEHPMSPIQVSAVASTTLTQPIVSLESIPVGRQPMSPEFPNTIETVAFIESPELSFSTDPPVPDVKPSVESAEPVEPLTLTKTKSKKKKKKRAGEDDGQSTSPHRKKAKWTKGDAKEGKKKHKPKIVVKTEDNI
ncbi:hypothetical protein GGI17_000377 [Coemansia sp. S146]|nr:hypothetical protein GGI17_000377 [Coemansia sp. S146]